MKRERMTNVKEGRVTIRTESFLPEKEEPVTNDIEIATFEARLRIDKHNLDEEVSQQPQQFMQVADRFALAKSVRDMAKDNLKTLEAKLSLDFRLAADTKGEKTTEKQLEALVQTNPERRKVFARFVDAERLVAQLEGLRDSYRDRGWMLREMCALHLATYNAESSVKGPANDAQNREYEANRARLAEERRKRERDKGGK